MYKIPVVRVCTSKRLTSFLFRFDFFEAFFPWGSMGTWRFASDDFPDAPEHHQFGHFSHRRSIHPRKYGFFLFHPKGFVYRYATCDTNLLTLQDIELHVVFFYFFLLDIIIYQLDNQKTRHVDYLCFLSWDNHILFLSALRVDHPPPLPDDATNPKGCGVWGVKLPHVLFRPPEGVMNGGSFVSRGRGEVRKISDSEVAGKGIY